MEKQNQRKYYERKNSKNMLKSFQEYLSEQTVICEMTNLYKEETGLPMVVWIDLDGDERKPGHNTPRLKIQGDKKDKFVQRESAVVSISMDPKVLEGLKNIKHSSKDMNKLFEWIKLNFETLMKQWNRTSNMNHTRSELKRI